MISHVVLFRPRADVTDAERLAFVDALEQACRQVPSVRRARIGRSLADDNGREYPYSAVMEFDDVAGLRAYLAHSIHQPLARLFHQTCEATLVVNAETRDAGAPLSDFLLGRSGADR
jgi:hypothetical protein